MKSQKKFKHHERLGKAEMIGACENKVWKSEQVGSEQDKPERRAEAAGGGVQWAGEAWAGGHSSACQRGTHSAPRRGTGSVPLRALRALHAL